MSELKPCPFCGKSKIRCLQADNGGLYRAVCSDCGSMGAIENSVEKVVEVWNKRAADADPNAAIIERAIKKCLDLKHNDQISICGYATMMDILEGGE